MGSSSSAPAPVQNKTATPVKQSPLSAGEGAGAPPNFSSLLGNPAYVASPAPVSAVGTATPAQVMGGSYNPATTSDDFSSTAATNAVEQAMAPQFAQQQGALTASLANAGIVGGTAPAASAALGQQQQTQLQSAIQPLIEQYKSMGLSQDQANAAAMNAAKQFGLGQNLSAEEANQQAGLQAGEFNAQEENSMDQYNASNLIQNAMYNSGLYTNNSQYYAGLQNQDWLAQLQAQTGLSESAAGGQTQAFSPIYNQPTPVNFNPGSFAPSSTTAAPTPTPTSDADPYSSGSFGATQ